MFFSFIRHSRQWYENSRCNKLRELFTNSVKRNIRPTLLRNRLSSCSRVRGLANTSPSPLPLPRRLRLGVRPWLRASPTPETALLEFAALAAMLGLVCFSLLIFLILFFLPRLFFFSYGPSSSRSVALFFVSFRNCSSARLLSFRPRAYCPRTITAGWPLLALSRASRTWIFE